MVKLVRDGGGGGGGQGGPGHARMRHVERACGGQVSGQ